MAKLTTAQLRALEKRGRVSKPKKKRGSNELLKPLTISKGPKNPDHCEHCDELIMGANVTKLGWSGVYHALCIPLEIKEREEYDRVSKR